MSAMERSVSTGDAPSAGKGQWRSLARLRRRVFQDGVRLREEVRSCVRLAMPNGRAGEDALVEALVGVCVQTVVDPYDATRAERAIAREEPRDDAEALEALCDWTVRRELNRLRRADQARERVVPR